MCHPPLVDVYNKVHHHAPCLVCDLLIIQSQICIFVYSNSLHTQAEPRRQIFQDTERVDWIGRVSWKADGTVGRLVLRSRAEC